MYYSIEKIENELVYLDFHGAKLCSHISKFSGDIHETDLVRWEDGMFVPDPQRTAELQKELHDRVHNIAE